MKKKGGGNQNIKVAVRLRPPLERETKEGNTFKNLSIDEANNNIK